MGKIEEKINRFFEEHSRIKPVWAAIIWFAVFAASCALYQNFCYALSGTTFAEVLELFLVPVVICGLFLSFWRLADAGKNQKFRSVVHRIIMVLAALMLVGFVFIAAGALPVILG